jgi:hypothetical protein
MYLNPGIHPAIVSGEALHFSTHVVVPSEATRINIIPAATGYKTAGAVLVPLGTLVGALMWMVGFACGFSGGSGCFLANVIIWPIVGASMLFTGIGFLAYAAGQHERLELRPLGPTRGSSYVWPLD